MGPDGEGRYNRADCWTLVGTRSTNGPDLFIGLID